MINADKARVGQIVYTYNHWSNTVEKGSITKLFDDGAYVQSKCAVDKNGKFICQTYGTGGGKFEDLYETALAAYAAQEVKESEKAAEYCEQIKDVPSLLTFALNHCLCGEEYTDYSAIRAYKASAKRLLGIDL